MTSRVMRKTSINRRQFMLTGAAATPFGLARKAEAFTHNSRLGMNSDRNSSDEGIPLLAQDYQVPGSATR
jgi:hypothetical protein